MQIAEARFLLGIVLASALASSGRPVQGDNNSCIEHVARSSLNSSQIVATNRCSKPMLANICARIDGRIGTITEGQRIEPGQSYTFDMFNAGKAKMRYNIGQCEPDNTLRRDLCIPSCPSEESITQEKQTTAQCRSTENIARQLASQMDEIDRVYNSMPSGRIKKSAYCSALADGVRRLERIKSKVTSLASMGNGQCDIARNTPSAGRTRFDRYSAVVVGRPDYVIDEFQSNMSELGC